MMYIGGGAGMAPLRSHIFHLFHTLKIRPKGNLLVWCPVKAGDVL